MVDNNILKENQEYAKVLDETVKLTSFPVAIKLIYSKDEVPDEINLIDEKIRHCEMVRKASYGDKFYSTLNEQLCQGGAGALGLRDMPPKLASGETYFNLKRFKDIEAAKNTVGNLSVVKDNPWGYVYAPLKDANFKADIVVVISEPKGILKISQAIVYNDGEHIKPSFAGIQSLCGDCVANPYNSKKYNISLGCDGSRKEADIKGEELIIGIHYNKLNEIVESLKVI